MVFRQLLRYGIVGILTNAAGYLVYLAITSLGLPPVVTMSVLYAFGAGMGFYGNRRWVFGHRGQVLGAFSRYALAHLVGYSVNLALLMVLVDRYGYPHQWVQGGAIFVVAGVLFVMFKLFVFPKTRDGVPLDVKDAHSI